MSIHNDCLYTLQKNWVLADECEWFSIKNVDENTILPTYAGKLITDKESVST